MPHRRPVGLTCALLAALAACSGRKSPPAEPDGFAAFHGPWARLAFPDLGAAPTPMDAVLAFPELRFDRPVFLTHAPDGTDRLFVVEQDGVVRVFPNDPAVRATTVFLDLRDRVRTPHDNEEGLLGLAFDPDYGQNGHLYVHYTGSGARRSVLARFTVDTNDPDRADPTSERILLEVAQPAGNHNGGMLAFGPDRMLYASFGDGGGGGDPWRTAQDLSALLGKVLRIDPHGGTPYAVPADNPFVGAGGGARPEIWAYGLRHPWRFSFDRQTGDLWLGDVGQVMREEIDLVTRGANLGWSRYEGTLDFNAALPAAGAVPPVIEYGRGDARSVIGGYVYRGTRLPELAGAYLHGDHVTGKIWALVADGTRVLDHLEIATVGGISSFGEDRDGEVYVVAHGSGSIYTFERPAGGGGGGAFPTRLSETGLFRDVGRLIPADGVLEYAVRSPLWSDGARKRRFVVLPRTAQIGFDRDGAWDFPRGTVLVKHFEIETAAGVAQSVRRLETRVLIHEDGGWAGYTYRWNADGSDAELLADRATDTLTVTDADGVERTFEWTFPSRTDCLQCHTEAAGRVLGVNTRQLNRVVRVAGQDREQLEVWSAVFAFTADIGAAAGHPRIADPFDETAPLADRARSYLDANCAACHRPGGPTPVDLDLRVTTPLAATGIVDTVPQRGDLGLTDARVVAPGARGRSVLFERMRRVDATRMPPLGSVVPHAEALELIGGWIDRW